MKKIVFHFFLLFTITGFSQIGNYNFFPTLQPQHILDEKLTNISFAYSMRVLESDYQGPLVRLRRASDNTEMDFGWGSNDIVDVAAINTWRGTSLVYMVTWYDQSKSGRNATQTVASQQPQFFPNDAVPNFQGDGSDDHLTVVNGNIQLVTNGGVEGTVIATMKATVKNQHSFGVLIGSDRWSTHVNWGNNNLYFDPGICCNSTRSFDNSAAVNKWEIYSFIKTNTNVIARSTLVERINGAHTTGRCTITELFAIGWATGSEANNHATTSYNEFIMYKTDIATAQIQEIEQDSKTFWNI